jgi:hypothetical protein
MLQAYKDLPFHAVLRGSLDGIPPHDARALLAGERFKKGVMANVLVHARMESRYAGVEGREVKRDLKRAGFGKELLKANFGKLEKLVRRLEWTPAATAWTGYGDDNTYDEATAAAKAGFVREAAARRRWALAWDVGCNDGRYTQIAAGPPTWSWRSKPTTRRPTRCIAACGTSSATASCRSSWTSAAPRPTWAGAAASARRSSAAGARSWYSPSRSCITSASPATSRCASSSTGCGRWTPRW